MNRPHDHLAETGERAIDQTLAQWVLRRTGSALLAAATRAASSAEGHGHSCAWLDDPQADASFDTDALQALCQHAWVGDGSHFTPFVLDAQNRFYLWRNWQHESTLAAAILQRCARRTLPIPAATLAEDLDALFAGMPHGPTGWQRAAVAAAPGARFFVLTGGPGTGKTTTVVRMLLMLLHHAQACGLPAQPSIALAAPTGKAAQRLVQAIAKGKAELQMALGEDRQPAGHVRSTNPLRPNLPNLLQQIPHADARTLHRLLGYKPMDNSFSRGPRNPLAEDIVVVDEASMVDLAMMRQLLEALRPDAVLILLGDPGQLASVDAGSVLADIVASAPQNQLPPSLAGLLAPLLQRAPLQHAPSATTDNAALAGQVLTLTHTWRAGSGLQRGIEALRNTPDPVWLDTLLRERTDGDLHLRHCPNPHALRACVDGWIERHADLLESLLTPAADAAAALQRLRQLQILCALRDGPFGAQGLNDLIARRLTARFGIDGGRAWYHGRPVIITRNDYARGLFNGDVGIALEGAEGLRVWFELSDRDGSAGLRSYSPRALPAHESAWAITIHRSQGSEYHDVAVLLPPDPDNRVLTRELVYTAISRARSHAEIWTTDDSLRAALARPIRRQGGLRERLQRS
ncbi:MULTISPECIES: exodeoxyribonuclease V subunit alpha [unclassified Rhodanobacter]|uniref:exodeoxyribonuclease V subunit alpha n=1 Tax=unclassified Rhodanobacter TaxID=2621553 RepID=UPI001BDF4858|nr:MULTISPECIES: exodeoxyribonuclease V subunit alpha [unclassified Rhodanobacter]MBT2142957.1 exodeoxyribonuclease V subunit alpha [Rhodanobacter sp. LX-99]MBT2147970.1 exodeoxyribonuclease V subunit alpha [Rhodanobacter sp. LX-100]